MTHAQFVSPRKEHLVGFDMPQSTKQRLLEDPMLTAVVAEIEGEAVAVGGLRPIISGRSAEGFIFFHPVCRYYPAVYVQIRKQWELMVYGLPRVQLAVDIRRPERIRFAYYLGCEPEAVLRRAGPRGEDMVIFARVN